MGYPERLLSADEVIETQFRPHWSRLLSEGLIVLVGIAVAVVLVIIGVPWWAYVVLTIVVIGLIVGGVVRWVNTLHVITNERLIYRAGFIAKEGTEIPLEVIQDVAFHQTILERMVGTGDLLIESAGAHGQTRYKDIPNPEAVQSLIYKAREARMQTLETEAPPANSTISDLERLSRLHDQGQLTDEEFETQKTKLLGGDT
ncbi:MAG TPA: PH domain-containing protein [Acidimicrobiia bacterium]|jgi:uncharacterized membrane protein YdbT with pleckstrin-like domain|nr:PH domain-containing protein [Acidimicrobiia bacterium]